eukprot:1922133-Rhodomonas_salina.2
MLLSTGAFRPSQRLYDENYVRCRLHSCFNFCLRGDQSLWDPHTMREMRCEAVVMRKPRSLRSYRRCCNARRGNYKLM